MRLGPEPRITTDSRSPAAHLVARHRAPSRSSSRGCARGTRRRRCRPSWNERSPANGASGSSASARSSRRNHGSMRVRSLHRLDARAAAQQLEQRLEAVGGRASLGSPAAARRGRRASDGVRSSSRERSALANACWKVRPIAIASPTDFMCVVSVGVGAGELLEGEARPLDDHVVDRRLEARGRGAGDVVVDLVQAVADGQPRGDLGDREAGRLGGERRASARRAGSSRSRGSPRSRG